MTRYSLKMGFRDMVELFRYHRKGTVHFAADAVKAWRSSAVHLEKKLNKSIQQMRILEIGSGQRYQNVLLFHTAGAKITGMDLEDVGPGVKKYFKMLFRDGLGRMVKSAARALLFDSSYYCELAKAYGGSLSHRGLDLRAGDAAKTNFADKTFDAVISTAVFEHIADVDGAVAEIARVLKPNGLCCITIHLFASLSGGHHLDWQNPQEGDTPTVPAWDHVRDNHFPSHTYLNKLKKKDYLNAFEKYMVIEGIRLTQTGESWMTDAIEKELTSKGYSRDELLETELRITARPKAAA